LIQLRRRNALSIYNGPEGLARGKDGRLSPEPVLGRLGQLSSPDVPPPVRHLRTPIILIPAACLGLPRSLAACLWLPPFPAACLWLPPFPVSCLGLPPHRLVSDYLFPTGIVPLCLIDRNFFGIFFSEQCPLEGGGGMGREDGLFFSFFFPTYLVDPDGLQQFHSFSQSARETHYPFLLPRFFRAHSLLLGISCLSIPQLFRFFRT